MLARGDSPGDALGGSFYFAFSPESRIYSSKGAFMLRRIASTIHLRPRFFSFAALAVAGFVSSADSSRAQDAVLPKVELNPEHALLAARVGDWEAVSTLRLAPDAEPIKDSGHESNYLACNGLFLISDYKGTFGGQSFQGHGIVGFDPAKKKYIGTWIDSMSPGFTSYEGTYDKATKTYTYAARSPLPDGTEWSYTTKLTLRDDDHRDFVMFGKGPAGENYEAFRIEYTRKTKKSEGDVEKKGAPSVAHVLGRWDLVARYGDGEDGTREYALEIREGDKKLSAVLISPRSGEHELEDVSWKEGTVRFVRVLEEGEIHVVFEGRLSDAGLEGKFVAKEAEEFQGTWKATKSTAKKAESDVKERDEKRAEF
jgi:hypothetical protein